jgi:plastocyanin
MLHFMLAALLTVAIKDFAYTPKTLTVNAGDSVHFVNKDDEAHTVTLQGGGFDSGGLDTGDSFTYHFTKPGTYTYFCALHPYMKGTIVVRPAKVSSK